MSEHPIDGLMETAMNSIKDMVDVNTIIGDPIETSNGMVIIPISKVSFGFAAGGSEFKGETIDEYKKKDKEEEVQYRLPFGGGSGAGISINPVAFVIVLKDSIKVLPIEHSSVIDKLMDYVPDLMQKTNIGVYKKMDTFKDNEKTNMKNNNTFTQSKNQNENEKNNSTQTEDSSQTNNLNNTQTNNENESQKQEEQTQDSKPKIKNPVKNKERIIKKIKTISEDINNDDIKMDEFLDE